MVGRRHEQTNSKKLVTTNLDSYYYDQFVGIIEEDKRLKGNVSLALREYIKSVVDEHQKQKKVEGSKGIFSYERTESSTITESLLPYIFYDDTRHIKLSELDAGDLYEFVTRTRSASLQAERIFEQNFNRKIYTVDNILLADKTKLLRQINK